jgi:hypothetical protein
VLPLHQYVLQTSLAPLASIVPFLFCVIWACILFVLVLTCYRR